MKSEEKAADCCRGAKSLSVDATHASRKYSSQAADLYIAYQVLAAVHLCMVFFLRVFWRNIDRSSEMDCKPPRVIASTESDMIGKPGWSFFVLQIAVDFVRIYGQTQTTIVVQVLMTLVVAVRAFRRVKRYASAERDWCLRVLNRMIMAVCFSCILSAASHILCLPAIFLAPEDVTAELIGLVFIVGILKPPEKVSFTEQSVPRLRALRGMSRLTEELPTTEENDKVQELALRSIDLSELLDFYESLGGEGSRMPHFDPCWSTTHDVVRQAIIPASRQGSGGMSYAELLQQTGHAANRMPDCMVTHSWSNLFLDLVAAVVADALGQEYDKVARCLRQGHVETLRQQLLTRGTLGNSYWFMGSYKWGCKQAGEPLTFCDCREPKLANDDPDCEVNKFDAMMLWLQYKNPRLRQLVAVDRKFDVFSRSWCIAELMAAHGADIPQSVCLETSKPFDPTAEDLAIYEHLVTSLSNAQVNLSVANSLSSRPEDDKEMILQKVSSVREFDAALQMLIFGNRGKAYLFKFEWPMQHKFWLNISAFKQNMTLHMSFALSASDLPFLGNLVPLAQRLTGALGGCVAELLLTVDPRKKTRGALREEVASDLGHELLSSLRHAAEVAAGVLGTTDYLLHFDSDVVLDPRAKKCDVNGIGLEGAVNSVHGDYIELQQQFCGVGAEATSVRSMQDHIYPKSTNSAAQWLTAAGAYLQNSTALQGLWSMGFDACKWLTVPLGDLEDCSPYPKGTVDLVLPLLPESRERARPKEFATLQGRCADAGGGKLEHRAKEEHLHQGDLDQASCEEMCRHAWMRCTGFEFHEPKGKEAEGSFPTSGCCALSGGYKFRSPAMSGSGPGIPGIPGTARAARPLPMLRSLLPPDCERQFSVNIDTILEMRMLEPLHPGSLIQPIAAFLSPERDGLFTHVDGAANLPTTASVLFHFGEMSGYGTVTTPWKLTEVEVMEAKGNDRHLLIMEAKGHYEDLLKAFGLPVIEKIERLKAVMMKKWGEADEATDEEVRQVIRDAKNVLGQKALSLEEGLPDKHKSILNIARGMNLTFRNTVRPKYANGAILLLSQEDTGEFLDHKDSLQDELKRLKKGLIVYSPGHAALVSDCLQGLPRHRCSKLHEPIVVFQYPVACWDLESNTCSSVATRQTRSTGHNPRSACWPQGKAARKCRFKLLKFKVPLRGTSGSDSESEVSQDLNAEMESVATIDIDSLAGLDEPLRFELPVLPVVKINLTSTKKGTEFADGCADSFVRVLGELKVLFGEHRVVNFMKLENLAAKGLKQLRREFARAATAAIESLRMELTVGEPGLKGDKTDPEAAIAKKVKHVLLQFQTLLDVGRDQLLKLARKAWQQREQVMDQMTLCASNSGLRSARSVQFGDEDQQCNESREDVIRDGIGQWLKAYKAGNGHFKAGKAIRHQAEAITRPDNSRLGGWAWAMEVAAFTLTWLIQAMRKEKDSHLQCPAQAKAAKKPTNTILDFFWEPPVVFW
ncbi:hypothetical protein AK812_SmicGene18652 [Symbiodinium microadriaticum]|uniref:Uncharacterized protein n=1 Tax=Symbiodinium microadriaticum TaxID=2951 RepID=A0A1Q9DUL5_SYMMI|nr:hypothetical protein AK812_SmicGene18652 [Symbiodinium microadriaticum]